MPGLDPISLGAGGLQTLFGLGQTLFSGAKKAERGLRRQIANMPKTSADQGIMGYYNQALARYGVSPTESALYKRSIQNIERSKAGALGALHDRRSALAGISNVLQSGSDAALNAEIAAENERNQRFGALGQATQMEAAEQRRVEQRNVYDPYELETQRLAQKLQGARQRQTAGMQNIMGGLSTLAGSGLKIGGGGGGSIGSMGSMGALGAARGIH